GAEVAAMLNCRRSMLTPVIGLERGLTAPITDLNMGQTAELVSHLFHITRRQSDEYAAESQQRLARAQKEGFLKNEVEPAFERPWGKVTPGNSSQITDGASWVILASEEAVKEHNLKPKAVIVDSEWSALDPSIMGLGPVYCSTALMKRHGLAL